MAITQATSLADFSTGIGTAGAVLQVDNVDGQVGIGTTDPQGTLQVGIAITMDGTAGVITASSFSGSGGNLSFTGADISAATGTFTGNVSVGGTLTYEDVTNIDSVGLITARNGINVLAGGVDVTGTLDVSNTATFGADANDVVLYGSSKILRIGASNGNNFQIQETGSSAIISQGTGYLKFSYDTGNDYKWAIFNNAGSVDLYHANNKKFETTNTGVTITGDISATGGTNAIGIQSGGQNISTGVITALNFVGAGNSLSVNGSTVDISISGGGGGGGSSIAASIALSSFLR